MARLPRIRENYSRDAAEMSRLGEAIEMDPHAPLEWKKEVMTLLYSLSQLLTRESIRRIGELEND